MRRARPHKEMSYVNVYSLSGCITLSTQSTTLSLNNSPSFRASIIICCYSLISRLYSLTTLLSPSKCPKSPLSSIKMLNSLTLDLQKKRGTSPPLMEPGLSNWIFLYHRLCNNTVIWRVLSSGAPHSFYQSLPQRLSFFPSNNVVYDYLISIEFRFSDFSIRRNAYYFSISSLRIRASYSHLFSLAGFCNDNAIGTADDFTLF